MVSELLTAFGQWNEDLIRAIFLPIDANAILRIPVRPHDDDWWALELEKYGGTFGEISLLKARGNEDEW